MSLFLVYTELGPSKPFAPPRRPLVAKPVEVHNQGRSGPPKRGWVITDGVASDRLLQYGTRVVGRQGDALRAQLFDFLARRLSEGARPVMCSIFVHGELEPIYIPMDERQVVPLGELAQHFSMLSPMEAVEVTR